jgi:hypothetical protein
MPPDNKRPAPVVPATGHTTISIDMAALAKLIAAGQAPPQITFLLRTPKAPTRGG